MGFLAEDFFCPRMSTDHGLAQMGFLAEVGLWMDGL